MRYGILLSTVFAVAAGYLQAEGPTKVDGAAAWVSAYEKAGGKASLALAVNGEMTLSIQKRKGQTPLVSLKGLKAAPGVRSVAVQGYELGDEDLESLAGWKDLEQIQVVDGIKVTDAGVKAIAQLPSLRSVELSDTAVTGKGVAAFSKHKSLVHLTLSNTNIAGRVDTLDLRNMPKLETITLAAEGITNVVLARLPQLRQVCDFPRSLEIADLSGLGRVRGLDFRRTRLKSLSISDVPVLMSLDLRETQVPEASVKALRITYPGVSILP